MGLNMFQLFMPCEVSLVLNLRGPNIVPRRPCVRRCQAFRHLPDKQNPEGFAQVRGDPFRGRGSDLSITFVGF